MLASRRARAAGVSDAVLSIGVASADLERELRTDSSSFPLPAAPPLPADRYVLALSKSPFSALRAMASRRLRSVTSNAGPVEDSPSKPDDDDEAGRAGSQSADDDDATRPSIAHPPPKTKGVEATSPHVIIGSSDPNDVDDDDDDDAALPCLPGSIRGVIATNVSFSRSRALRRAARSASRGRGDSSRSVVSEASVEKEPASPRRTTPPGTEGTTLLLLLLGTSNRDSFWYGNRVAGG
jgi:hypothetical protein